MSVRDEHAILRSLEDCRIAGAMEPESPESMRQRAIDRERTLRNERQIEQQLRFHQQDVDFAERQAERARERRIEAWKRGEPVKEQPQPEPEREPVYTFGSTIPADVIVQSPGWMSASSMPYGFAGASHLIPAPRHDNPYRSYFA